MFLFKVGDQRVSYEFRAMVIEHTTKIPNPCIYSRWSRSSDVSNGQVNGQRRRYGILNRLCGPICHYNSHLVEGNTKLKGAIIRVT